MPASQAGRRRFESGRPLFGRYFPRFDFGRGGGFLSTRCSPPVTFLVTNGPCSPSRCRRSPSRSRSCATDRMTDPPPRTAQSQLQFGCVLAEGGLRRHGCAHWRTGRSRLDPTHIFAIGKPAAYMSVFSHRVQALFGPPDALSFTSDHLAAVGTTWSYIRRLG